MTQKKTTKRALFASIISLLLCVSMLIGSTFAWFTDTATTGVNVIKSGNLEIGFEYANGTEAIDTADWKNAEGASIFNYEKWEPGYTVAKHIRITNKGSLAFKYELDFMLNGKIGKLAEVIDVYFADPAQPVADRTAVESLTKVGTLKEFLENTVANPENGKLLAGESVTVTIVLKMQETAGNDYQNATVGDGLTVSIFATQYTYENDVFDDQYDVNAPTLVMIGDTQYDTIEDAVAAAENGETIEISGFFDNLPSIQNKTITIKAVKDHKAVINMMTTVNGNGSALTFDGITLNTLAEHDGDKNGITHVNSTSFKNCILNGSLTMYGTTASFEKCTFVNYVDYNVWTYGVNVTFTDCTFVTGGKAILVYQHAASTSTVTVNNCVFNSNGKLATDKAAIEVGDDPSKSSNHTIVINNSTTSGFAANNSSSSLWGNKNNMPADRLKVTINNQAQSILRYIYTADDLFAFAKEVNEKKETYAGKTVVLAADIDLENKAWTPIGQTGATQFLGTFDGQNHTISNLSINNDDDSANCATGLFGWVESGDTIKNVKVSGANVTGHHNVGVIAGYIVRSVTIDNCDVENATVSCTHANNDACGDKAGTVVGIVGSNDCYVKNCDVSNSVVKAGRDAGQVIGAWTTLQNNTDLFTNCTADNVNVSATGNCTGANVNNELIGRLA